MSEQQLLEREVTDTGDHLSTADIAAGNFEKPPESSGSAQSERSDPLFARQETEDFRQRWQRVQTGFVDEPRKAVQEADELVAAAMKRLAEIFAAERDKLEHEWDKNENVSTEDLRVALRRYRSFFDRLLSV